MDDKLTSHDSGQIFLAFGKQSPESLGKAIRALGPDSIFCTDTARMAGATIAAGNAQALHDLRQRLKPAAIAHQKTITPSLSDAANAWLSHGQRSLSADTVFQFLTGTPLIQDSLMHGYPFHPKTVEDMQKCIQLLEAVPDLRQPFGLRMGSASAPWSNLARRWTELVIKVQQEGRMLAQVAILEALEGLEPSK